MTDVETQVRELIARAARTEPEAIALDADLFTDLGIDSLEGLKLMAAFEKRWGVTIPDHQLLKLNTPRRIVEALEAELKGQEVAP